jgi:hypothetical protein
MDMEVGEYERVGSCGGGGVPVQVPCACCQSGVAWIMRLGWHDGWGGPCGVAIRVYGEGVGNGKGGDGDP